MAAMGYDFSQSRRVYVMGWLLIDGDGEVFVPAYYIASIAIVKLLDVILEFMSLAIILVRGMEIVLWAILSVSFNLMERGKDNPMASLAWLWFLSSLILLDLSWNYELSLSGKLLHLALIALTGLVWLLQAWRRLGLEANT